MSKVPEDLHYTKDHEWVKVEGKRARVGVTDYAQGELTDIVYVEIPSGHRKVTRGEKVADVESVKTVAEVYAPVGGTVVEINKSLEDHPELINQDPYGTGWVAVIELADVRDVSALMDARAYRAHIGES